jgi:hypothetical protein
MSDIEEVSFEELVLKSGEDASYFMVYLNTEKHLREYGYINKMLSYDNNLQEVAKKYYAWFEVKIPYDYEKQNGKIKPTYKEELASCEMYWTGEEGGYGIWSEYFGEKVDFELTEDEKLMLINACIRNLLEDFVYYIEFIEKKAE